MISLLLVSSVETSILMASPIFFLRLLVIDFDAFFLNIFRLSQRSPLALKAIFISGGGGCAAVGASFAGGAGGAGTVTAVIDPFNQLPAFSLTLFGIFSNRPRIKV